MNQVLNRVGAGLAAVAAVATFGLISGSTSAAAAGCSTTQFGVTGAILCGSKPLYCAWGHGFPDEAFAIAPSGNVYHIWRNGIGWQQMPNGGKAVDTHNCYWNGNGFPQVEVETSSGSIWYSYYDDGWWGWYLYS